MVIVLITTLAYTVSFLFLTPAGALLPGLHLPLQHGTRSIRPHKIHGVVLQASAQDDPDLMGVLVDGYPIPPIPTRPDDSELLERLASVPGRGLTTLSITPAARLIH
jgi:hypothetical protein